MRMPRTHVRIGGTTVTDRIRLAVRQSMQELLDGEDANPVGSDRVSVQSDEKPSPPEYELGADIFQMPDGTFALRTDLEAARNRPDYVDPDSPEAAAPMLAQHRIYYRNLLHLVTNQRTPCRGDGRYTADALSDADIDEMRRTCIDCHAFGACGIYRRYAAPTAGFWAGIPHHTALTPEQKRRASSPRMPHQVPREDR